MLVLRAIAKGMPQGLSAKWTPAPFPWGPPCRALGFSVGIQDLARQRSLDLGCERKENLAGPDMLAVILALGGNIANPMPITLKLQGYSPRGKGRPCNAIIKIFCEGLFFGNTITDIVRIKQADGTFATAFARRLPPWKETRPASRSGGRSAFHGSACERKFAILQG